MVHHVNQSETGIQNNLIVHQAIIPAASLSSANFFAISLDKLTLTILENMTVTVCSQRCIICRNRNDLSTIKNWI